MSNKLDELDRQVRPITLKAAREARQNGSTRARALPAARSTGPETTRPEPHADLTSHPDLFLGLVGDVARAASHGTDVPPVAVAAGFLSFLGAYVGRDVYYPIGDAHHHPRLYTLHIGRSSRGAKGDSLQLVKRIHEVIGKKAPGLLGKYHFGGLSSGEGLAKLIHDGIKTKHEDIPPVHDKRIWVVEHEFGNVLAHGRRDGNTLSLALRTTWDGMPIQPATKSGNVWASDPHIGLSAAITPSELIALMRSRDLSNGFANRFLMFWAERSHYEPEPKPTPADVVAFLADRAIEVISLAKGKYPDERDTRPMLMTQAARALWREAHHSLRCDLESETLTALLERRAPNAVRLAMLFALCDLSLVIEERHIRSALAWVDYCCRSVRHVFATDASEAQAEAFDQMRNRIRAFLAMRPDGATKQELTNECFNRERTEIPLHEVLARMEADPRCGLIGEVQPRKDGRPGRSSKTYKLTGVTGVRNSG